MILLACAQPEVESDSATSAVTPHVWTSTATLDAGLAPLDDARLLRRMSLDLRGVLPTAADLDAVEADAGAVATVQAGYLDDPLFEENLVAVLSERWLTEVDEYLIFFREFPAMAENAQNEYPWERAVGQEPLRLIARIAATDAPYTDIVTADYTMANEYIGKTWPVDYPADATGWQVAHYTDGRPAAGVLATNGLWWRYYTTFTNYNRGRAAALAKLLLCVDYLSRPVSFSVVASLDDEDVIGEALQTNPYCQGCHASLDPLASALFGFWVPQEYSAIEMATYHPEREPLGADLMGVAPAWYGYPVSGLAELGSAIAADPRFSRCAVQSAAESYWGRAVELDDFDRIEALRVRFESGGQRYRALVQDVMATPVYRAGGLTSAATETQAANENTSRMMTLRLYASTLEDLTGFRWTWNRFDQLDNDDFGYRVLGGSVDGNFLTRPQRTPSLSSAAVFRRVAEAAAVKVTQEDLVLPAEDRRLLGAVVVDAPASDPQWRDAAAALRWRLFARRPTEAELDEDADLFAALAEGGETEAWSGLLASYFRDPDFVAY